MDNKRNSPTFPNDESFLFRVVNKRIKRIFPIKIISNDVPFILYFLVSSCKCVRFCGIIEHL